MGLLSFRHIALNRPPWSVDITNKMSITHNTSIERSAETSAKFAHELANLLDGSMRNVSLVRSLMSDKTTQTETAKDESALLKRLQTAEHSMKQMATLLKNWLKDNHHPALIATSGQTLSDVLFQARELHAPAASAMGIEINIHVTGEAARLPAGPVFSIIANALRNSIEAISSNPKRQPGSGLIEVRAQVQTGQVRVAIADNGPGLSRELFDTTGIFRFDSTTKPDGHGLGLSLCRDIATSLGGNLRVSNRDEGGALVTLTYAAIENTTTGKQESRK